MIRLQELLEDERYRQYFCKVPRSPNFHNGHKNWRVFVQREIDGPWAKRDFEKYAEAFRFTKKWLPKCHDAAIQSRARQYKPPMRFVALKKNGQPLFIIGSDGVKRRKTKMVLWQPRLLPEDEHHEWCPYCRRPTVRAWFSKHHNFPDGIRNNGELRCVICGAPDGLIRGRR